MTFNPSQIEIIATVCFFLAIIHIFSVSRFEKLAKRYAHDDPKHDFFHMLAEIETVFGIWAVIFAILFFFTEGFQPMYDYLSSRNYTEGLFVPVVMVIAATRPVLKAVNGIVMSIARLMNHVPGVKGSVALYFVVLALVPILGSFITEPAAITLAALILYKQFYSKEISKKLKYATIATLFVNVSIGGTLTNFAAPPVLMVASTWDWSTAFMLKTFGWKAVVACVVSTLIMVSIFYKELVSIEMEKHKKEDEYEKIPMHVTLLHFAFLAIVVAVGHYPVLFLPIFIIFLGVCTNVYRRYQEQVILPQALLVGLFLCGIVILGGMQTWWLEPVLMGLSNAQVVFGAIGLGAFTDNAAITYLGSQVPNLSDEFKYALVYGAVAGGGMTVIANAPNPAAVNILKPSFENQSIEPISLALWALPSTVIALIAFTFL